MKENDRFDCGCEDDIGNNQNSSHSDMGLILKHAGLK